MRSIFTKNRFIFCSLFLLGTIAASCKKSDPVVNNPVPGGGGNVASGTRSQQTLDSLFLYAKQIYFWNDALPDYNSFNPRQYSSQSLALDNYNAELYALSQIKINPATGKPYEYYGDGAPKYSYIQDLTLVNPSASSSINTANVDTEGNGNDIGIRPIFYLSSNSLNGPYELFVTAVYQNSPAEAAGVKRGWVITKVNGQTIGASYNGEQKNVSDALNGFSVAIEGFNFSDNVPFKLTLNKTSYKSSPVYASKVFTKSGRKIGYLAFARFSALTNSSTSAPSDANLDPVFSDFAGQGITDLIVDLRYNGGGYINTAQYMANLIAPSSVNGKKMFTEIYNTTMQNGQASILANQPLLDGNGKVQRQNGQIVNYTNLDFSQAGNTMSFVKKGSLNTVNNVVFIVSRNTASASELVINSLKPYMNVKLVGDTTYGKPVGFFPVTLENRYEVFMSLFETRNSNNEGGYYTGMVPTVLSEFNDPRYPFGDERENYLSLALNLISPSATVNNSSSVMSIGARNVPVTSFKSTQLRPVNPNSEFIGMIEKRHVMKK